MHLNISYSRFFITLVMLLSFSVVSGQKRYKCRNTLINNEFRVGARAGFELANMYLKKYDTQYETSPVFGLHGGLMAEYIVQEVISFQAGISYFEAGTEARDELNVDPTYLNIKMKGVQLPLLIQPRFSKDGIIIFGSFGGYLGYHFSGSEQMSGAGADSTYSSAISFSSASGQYVHRHIDFGLSAGGGMEYNNVIIGAFYNFGLVNITSAPSIANNKILGFSVAYMFGLGK